MSSLVYLWLLLGLSLILSGIFEYKKINIRFLLTGIGGFGVFFNGFFFSQLQKLSGSLLAFFGFLFLFELLYKLVLIKLIEEKKWFKVILYSQLALLILITNLAIIFIK